MNLTLDIGAPHEPSQVANSISHKIVDKLKAHYTQKKIDVIKT